MSLDRQVPGIGGLCIHPAKASESIILIHTPITIVMAESHADMT